ncbi:MAG: hypothetical protein IMF06_07390 [Proteobacteria bacterium]|nr:hypothetical protein [Pseudomonadota bacterium]
MIALHDLFSINIERETPLALFELAQSYGVTAYDAAYLLLARNAGLPLATEMSRRLKTLRQFSWLTFY